MKMRPEHIQTLRAHIAPLDTPERRARYAAGDFPRAAGTKDVNLRYRWDLLWAAAPSGWVAKELYPYLNDEHIDTALRRLVKPLGVNVR